MFSIENLLSNKYTSKLLQRKNCLDSSDSSDPKLSSQEASQRKENATEVNVFAGKRDTVTVHFGQTAAKGIGEGERGDDRTEECWSRISTKAGRSRKRRSDGESDSERDSESEECTALHNIIL